MNRSTISSAKAAAQTNSSGPSGMQVGKCGQGECMSSLTAWWRKLIDQRGDRRIHQVDQRLRVHAQSQHADREHAQHPGFAGVDVGQLGDVVIGDFAEDHALDHPQGVGGTEDQRECGNECDQWVRLERWP